MNKTFGVDISPKELGWVNETEIDIKPGTLFRASEFSILKVFEDAEIEIRKKYIVGEDKMDKICKWEYAVDEDCLRKNLKNWKAPNVKFKVPSKAKGKDFEKALENYIKKLEDSIKKV